MLFNKKDFDSKQRFSIRKLSVGVCSVLLSTLFLTFNEGQTVHASTNVNAADTTTTSVSSNTTNNSSDNNTDKKDDSKVEASSLATAEKHAPIPIAAEIKSNKSEDQTNSASAETDTQVSKSKQAQNQTTTNIVKATDTQAATSSKDSSDTTSSKDNSAQNTVYDTKTTSYTPTYSLSGLETNSDGSLDSGVQTATVRVSVPKGTIGAKVDADGTYYYELGNGASIPSQYTLAAFSQTTPVVKVPIHQKMHFYITVHDEDSNTNLGTVEVSGSTAGNGGGWYPNINTKLTFPAGADAGDYYSVSTSGVPDGVQLVGSYGVSLTNPTADWTNPNYKWDNNTFSVLKALTGATMTINLKHKIQETQEQQTRKPTVNYIKAKVNADGTYTPDGSAFTSAVLDVYYSRTKSKDLVTKKVTYTPWLWDTKQGQNGYHVESGTWTSLPQSWGAVVADVPTLDGYTAATVTDQSGQPANQFVYPTWNKAGTSDEGKESLAYTENAPIYEARPVHTVLYVPNEQQARTITSKYVIAGGNKNGQQFAPDSQIQIFYDRTGTLNVANNTITYGNWQWDNTAGDRATPGFHVISGSWSLPTDKTSSWQVNIPNSGNDYVVANLRYDGAYSTFTLAAPSYNANDVFTSPTSDQWFTRNILVTYYVPTSMVNKTVTRTIKISEPGQDSKTITQTVKLTRQVRVNQDDTGVVYDGFAGSGWSTGNWAAQDVPTHGGYTMYATQTVNGVTTPIQLVNGQIPAEPVNGTSQDTTINITWGAVAKATLTGTGTSTYNGQAITNAELNNALKVNVTGPTAGAGTYTLQAGDVEFSIDGTNWTTALPINAGNYQVRLTAQGKNGIIGKYGNNSIIWTQNGQSTITSNATYMINKLADNAVMANAQSGNYEMTYNGAAPSTIDPSKFVFTTTVNGQTVTLDATGLNSSDFTWADGNAPVNVGTYKVVLTDAGLAKLNANNPNFDLTNSGNGTFTINQANASATLSGSASREYNGQAVSVDDLNSTSTGNNITLTLHYPKDGNANYSTTVKLNNGYFTWDTPNGQAPVNADSQPYTIVLNSDAIEGIIKQAVGNGQNDVSNVKFASDAISGSANYTITPLVTSAKLSNITEGNYTKVYDAQATNQIDASKLHITVNLGGQKVDLDTTGLTGSDYQWVDASGTALTSNPKNVGTYYIKLSDTAFAKLQAQNPNFKLTNTGLGVYTITQANASGELTGSNSKVYNGSAISLNELNSNGSIKVTLNFPGSSAQSTYALQAGDYTWENKDGQEISAPTNAGTYTIKLRADSITNLQNAINQYAGQGNVTLDAQDLLGAAVYTIKQKTLNVILGNNSTGTDGKTYDGQPAVINTQAENFGVFTTSGLVNGEDLNAANLTNDDYEWVDANGKAISAPTNAGTYYISLTANGLKKLQADNPNYAISESGQFTYVISPAEENVIISGSQESTSTSIDNANFTVHAPAGITVPTGMAYEFATGVPSESGVYVIKLTPESIAALEKTNPNYKLNISSDARFTLDATLSIEFEDTQDGNKQVGKTITKTGVANSTINDLKLVVPDNYELAPDQELPTSYTFGKTLNQNLYIKLVHKLNELNPTDPSTNPDPTNKNWFRENGLVKDVTRTINYEGLSTAQLAQIPETQKAQTVEFTRTAKYDLVTGKIVVNSEGSWTAVDGKDIFAGFTPFAFAGYTAAPAKVEQVKVTGNDKNSQITVTYTANNQTGRISYVDSQGNEVGQTALTGKTDQSVAVTPEAPTGWIIVAGQDIPKSVTATATGIPTVTVKVEHSTTIVTPETPEKDIPTGPVPGDPSKNYEKMESLTASPTRTIVVTDPSGKTTKVTQTVNFTRTATFDEVTGKVTYSDWKLQNSNASNHAAQWDSYTPHVITHYVPSVAEVPAKVVNAHTANSQVEITYAPASESQVIRYVDQNGKEISTQIVSGKYGLDTTFTPKLPNNWQAANTIPTSIKIGENGGLTTIVIEAKTEKVQQSKTVTETIHYHTANGKQIVADKEMKVNFTRTGVKNLVTGEITWNSWNNAEEIFNEVPSPKVSGYTASPAKVAAQTVTPNSEDLVFNVIYTKNSQTYPTIPENKPNKPQEENVSKQETKTQDKLIHEYGYKKRADGRLVDHTGHVYPASSKVKENGAIYSEKGELLSVGSRRKHELPQTGLHDNSLIAAIGSLLAGISIFGLLGGRKKKDDDK